MAQFRSFVDPLIIMLAVPLGLGGMVASTVLTLVLVPCVYSLVHQNSRRTAVV